MPTMQGSGETDFDPSLQLPPLRLQTVAAAAIFGAWMAAGSCGLIADPLRHALTLVSLLAIFAAGFPSGDSRSRRIWSLVIFAALAIYLSASASTIVSALGVLVLLCGVAMIHPGSQRTLRPAIFALLVLALYRLAHDNIPAVWWVADALALMLSEAGARCAGMPLSAGATFAGVDFLVVMLAFEISWIAQSPPPRLGRLFLILAGILATHLVYLMLLAESPLAVDSVPANCRGLIPWNLPLLAGLMQTSVVVLIMRWSRTGSAPLARPSRIAAIALPIFTAIVAISLPVITMLQVKPLDLRGKNVLLLGNQSNAAPKWLDRFGPDARVASDLSGIDLSQVDVIVADRAWNAMQLNLFKKYVLHGGTLLAFVSPGALAKSDSLLQDVHAKVEFVSVPAVSDWMQCWQTTAGPLSELPPLDPEAKYAAIEAGWPARPISVGRFAMRAGGDQRLGDLILSMQQELGRGRIILANEPAGPNGANAECLDYAAKLLAYSADRDADPWPFERQIVGTVVAILLLLLIILQPHPMRAAACALLLAASISVCIGISRANWKLPTVAQPATAPTSEVSQ